MRFLSLELTGATQPSPRLCNKHFVKFVKVFISLISLQFFDRFLLEDGHCSITFSSFFSFQFTDGGF